MPQVTIGEPPLHRYPSTTDAVAGAADDGSIDPKSSRLAPAVVMRQLLFASTIAWTFTVCVPAPCASGRAAIARTAASPWANVRVFSMASVVAWVVEKKPRGAAPGVPLPTRRSLRVDRQDHGFGVGVGSGHRPHDFGDRRTDGQGQVRAASSEARTRLGGAGQGQ